MLRSFVTSAALALAVLVLATPAAAQNPFNINGVVPDDGVPTTSDPSDSQKELGPKNASNTKVGVINTAPTVMLDFTNPNGNVDLKAIYMQSKKAVDGHSWLYFAWQRDANSGSGFIAFEFEQQKVSPSCVYTAADIDQILPQTAGETTLINTCNPWRNRQTGDFMILWDQSGSALNITKRVFTQGVGFGTPKPLGTAVAAIGSCAGVANSSGFCGEAAIDLNVDVFGTITSCQTFANIIPGTVTGNSDSADYKDTVFAAFEPISNCGSVQVIKKTNPADQTGTFPFTLARTSGNVRYDGTASLTRTFTQDGQTETFLSLIPAQNYTLAEAAQTSPWALDSIECVLDGDPAYNVTTGGTFPVAVNEKTVCTITNKKLRGSIQVIKHVKNDNGGTAVASQFTISLGDGATPTTFAGHETPGDLYTFDAGYQFDVAEIGGPSGYTLTNKSGDCSGKIESGVTKVCTLTNDDNAAHLIIIKQVTNDNGGTNVAGDFSGTVSGVTVAGGGSWVGSDTGVDLTLLSIGSYTVTENTTSGYDVSYSLQCSGTIALGETKTCTVTNNDAPARLIIIKHVINDNGATNVAADFSGTIIGVDVDGGGSWAGAENPGVTKTLVTVGTYNVTESLSSAMAKLYDVSYSADCSTTIKLGETKTCTVTNNDKKAGPAGDTDQKAILRDSITITNIRANADDAAAATVTFRLYSDAACSNQIGSEGPVGLTYSSGGAVGSAATANGILIDPAPGAPQASYYWRVSYSGDKFNNTFVTACGAETTSLAFAPK